MQIISVDRQNIDSEHICCAISDKKGENCVGSKKTWLKQQFPDGLVFKKLDARGKVFIEYIPAEKAFAPIIADNYIYIDCFWVSGKFKGQGHANNLLDECINDAKQMGKDGLVVLSSAKKRSFLSDPGYLKYKGFKVADTAQPFFELLYLPFHDKAGIPKFNDCAKSGTTPTQGVVLYYTNQCPHTDKYVPIIVDAAQENNIDIEVVKIDTADKAQNACTPFTTYSLFVDGQFVTNEILTQKKFLKIMQDKGKLAAD